MVLENKLKNIHQQKEIKVCQLKRKTEEDFYAEVVDVQFQNMELIDKVECYETELKTAFEEESKLKEKMVQLNEELQSAKDSKHKSEMIIHSKEQQWLATKSNFENKVEKLNEELQMEKNKVEQLRHQIGGREENITQNVNIKQTVQDKTKIEELENQMDMLRKENSQVNELVQELREVITQSDHTINEYKKDNEDLCQKL